MEFKLTTPVAFIIFNRPDVTFRVFERIRRAKPTQLFIIADGPRPERGGVEAEKCEQCRSIKDKVDWDCEVHVNFAEKNMGCKNRVYSGISWVFENVDEAIILEDDCLPSLSFFRFCQELLEKYRNDTRIMTIAGSNHDFAEEFDESYNFVSRMYCWGWATWKRSWNLNDVNMTLWAECRKGDYLRKILSHKEYVELTNAFQLTYEGKVDTWDYQFCLANYLNHGLNIVPKINLVWNIGFRPDATHTLNLLDKGAFYLDEEIEFPLIHPRIMLPRENLDENFEPQPSQEELQTDFQQRDATFKHLMNTQNYDGVVNYFKDTLKNGKFIHFSYVYYLAFACLMKNDYEHAVELAENILSWNVISPQSFMIFVQMFFSQQHFSEAFTILDKILERVPTVDDQTKTELIALVQNNIKNFSYEKYPNIAKLISY